MGFKVVAGRETRDWAICVQVLEKKPVSGLSAHELGVPPLVETLTADPGHPAARTYTPTDVREVEPTVLCAGERWAGWHRRPAWGGLEVGLLHNQNAHKGTMTVADWGGGARIFTAGHVAGVLLEPGLPDRLVSQPSMPVYQPPRPRKGDPARTQWRLDTMRLGVMENSYPVLEYPANHEGPFLFNTYDLAWAIPTAETSYVIGDPASGSAVWPSDEQSIRLSDIGTVGPPDLKARPYVGPGHGLRVAFAGTMTGRHDGTVRSVHSLLRVFSGDTKRCNFFRDLIRVGPVGGRVDSGDSGAVLVSLDDPHKGLGLGTLVGDSPDSYYFARIPGANPGGVARLQQPFHPPGPDPKPET
ncbi:hypothetical protein ACIQ62_28725 [Streptomyces sp. NPDC096319]|uniref:hypothetical protein n=1 Tax=Streptomyces sp. NPDC096319 TaxID=3366084 RepID=UPI003807393E